MLHLQKAFSSYDQNCSVGKCVLIVQYLCVMYAAWWTFACLLIYLIHFICIKWLVLFMGNYFIKGFLYSPENQSCSVICEKWSLISKQAVIFLLLYIMMDKNKPFFSSFLYSVSSKTNSPLQIRNIWISLSYPYIYSNGFRRDP